MYKDHEIRSDENGFYWVVCDPPESGNWVTKGEYFQTRAEVEADIDFWIEHDEEVKRCGQNPNPHMRYVERWESDLDFQAEEYLKDVMERDH